MTVRLYVNADIMSLNTVCHFTTVSKCHVTKHWARAVKRGGKREAKQEEIYFEKEFIKKMEEKKMHTRQSDDSKDYIKNVVTHQ